MVGHRMVFHILTAEGDLKDVYAIPTEYTPMWGNGDSRDDIYKSVQEMSVILNGLQGWAYHFPVLGPNLGHPSLKGGAPRCGIGSFWHLEQ